ncbi:MAG: hypothetical protein PHW53_01935 [Patescibacteria group bacterium]|nr:hypothetical protein [Patescibacteria group bacterium]
MPQKYQNELNLLRIAIEKTPFSFSRDERSKFETRLAALEANPETKRDEIETVIVEVGKATWPHRKAYEGMFAAYAKEKYEEQFINNLDDDLRVKYENFTRAGGSLHDYRRTREMEQAFTPEEYTRLEDAIFEARKFLDSYMETVIAENSDEYNESVKRYESKQRDCANMIESLKEIARTSEKWAPEIMAKVRKFEEGWSAIERDFDEDQLKHEIEYWQGVIGLE